MKKALILFIRNPEYGKVKTRLAEQIGKENALKIYLLLLEHSRSVAHQSDCAKYVFSTTALGESWKGFIHQVQATGDLGNRMKQAFQYLFTEGFEKILIIGSDCPGLTSMHIEKAFTLLECNDVVIGPAHDGGYYLLGMNKLEEEIFMNKHWSTPAVLKQTLDAVYALGLRHALLETLSDVDEEKDMIHMNNLF